MNLELISYTQYPKDQYTKAICTLKVDGKYLLSYGKKMTKNGGSFWAMATHSVQNDNDKEFVEGYFMDSRADDKRIMEFVKQCEKVSDLGFSQAQMPASSSDESLPF